MSNKCLASFICGMLLLVGTTGTFAQEKWQLGFELNPSYYMMLNATDNNAPPDVVRVTVPNILEAPRAWAVGAKVFYGFNEHIGIQTGLRYSWGRQDYSFTNPTPDPTFVALPDGSITTELNYLQVPICFQYQITNKFDDVFYLSAGVAPAWLFHYYERYVHYRHTLTFPPDGRFQETIQTDVNNDVSWTRSVDGTITESYDNENNLVWLYQKFVLFGMAEIGYKRYFNNGWGLNIGLNSYVSLIEPENRSAPARRSTSLTFDGKYKKERSDNTGDTIDDRAKTTLLFVGVTVGLVYNFDW
jgi:hypothetical protein